MKKTLNAIAKLANSSHFLTSNEFPNAKNSEKCRCSLALIDDLTNRIIAEEETVSSIYLKTLKINFTKYMKSMNTGIPRFFLKNTDIPRFLLNKHSIKQIIYHLGDTEIYDYPISKSDDLADMKKVLLLLEIGTTTSDLGKDFSVSLLKFYYTFYNSCSEVFISNMKKYLDKHYSEKYYLSQQDFTSLYSRYDNGEANYSDFLRNLKVNTNFISTKFFQEIWYIWCLTRKANTYSESFFKNNKDRINSEHEDYRKCILAVITCQVNKLDSRESLITTHLLPMFGSVNPADKIFWEISSQELKSRFSDYLEKAPKIYYKYFTKTFLESFFLVLSSGDSTYEKERSIFWLNYIDQIEEFKIGVTDYKDSVLQRRLSQLPGDTRMYMTFYKNCKIHIYKDSDPATLLMKLNNILAIEFTENGNAAYLYRKDNDFAQKLFNKSQVNGVTDFKFQDSQYGFIERIIHNGYWQDKANRALKR